MAKRITFAGQLAFLLLLLPCASLASGVTFHGTSVLNENTGALSVQIFRMINTGSSGVDVTVSMFERGSEISASIAGELHAGTAITGFPSTVTVPSHAFLQTFGMGQLDDCGDVPEYLTCSNVYMTATWEEGAPIQTFTANIQYVVDMTEEELSLVDIKVDSISQVK
jgi:hypothetical protein